MSFNRAKNEKSKNQNLGRQSREMGKSLARERNFERNIGREDKFRVSGGSDFQSWTDESPFASDDRTYGMERTSESEDRAETKCDGNERLM